MTRVRQTRILAGTALAAILMAAGNQARAETTGGEAPSSYGCSSLEEIAELQDGGEIDTVVACLDFADR